MAAVRRRLPLVIAAVAVFLAVSFVLARWLSTENAERAEVLGVLSAQARGDARGMLDRLPGCAADAACARLARENARRLRRAGKVRIVRLDSGTSYALGSARGPTRVVWAVLGRGITVVQCVDVQRSGNALAGRAVTLRRLSAPIRHEGSCPGR